MNQSVSKINHVDVVNGSPAPFAAVKVMDSTAVVAAVTVSSLLLLLLLLNVVVVIVVDWCVVFGADILYPDGV